MDLIKKKNGLRANNELKQLHARNENKINKSRLIDDFETTLLFIINEKDGSKTWNKWTLF
jgi:hypothetical protein